MQQSKQVLLIVSERENVKYIISESRKEIIKESKQKYKSIYICQVYIYIYKQASIVDSK